MQCKCSFLSVALLLVVFDEISAEVCPNITALQNVNAHYNLHPGSRTRYEESINFYALENYTSIHVVKANVSVLCEGMVNSFRRLKTLALTNANISKILPAAFKQVSNLRSLSLTVNNLVSIEKEQFKNLENLNVLYLSANKIENVERDAFSELIKLRKIYLDKNNIFEINSEWFLNNPEISLINLAFNRISKVQAEAFVMGKNRELKLHLQHNVIEEVESKVIISNAAKEEEKSHVILGLDHNKLEEIPEGFISSMEDFQGLLSLNNNHIACVSSNILEELTSSSLNVSLINNPLTCSCMLNITQFLQDGVIKEYIVYTTTQDCTLYNLKPPLQWHDD